MTTVSATPAQRITARDKCAIATKALWTVAQNSRTPSTAEGAVIDTALTAASTALSALGAGLASTAFLLQSGTKVNAVSVTGTGNFATPTIVGGVITGIVLSAS